MFTWKLKLLALGTVLLVQNFGHAQVVTDGTVGDATTLTGPDYDIGADLGTLTGNNLFHSFDQFSITTGESATFSGPNSVNNIIGRVTGGDVSLIDGRLASTIQGADLWLLNPAGVVFGANASLDVQGSFHVSTADELRMEDGSKFSASDPSSSVLSTAAPQAFGFLGADPAGITVDGSQLSVSDGETLSLVGGDIDISGANLSVEQGQLNLLAASGPAEATIATGDVDGADDGAITLRQAASLSATGDGGGGIRIEGGAFVVDEASTIASINTGFVDGDVGIDVDVETADITGGSLIATAAQSSSTPMFSA